MMSDEICEACEALFADLMPTSAHTCKPAQPPAAPAGSPSDVEIRKLLWLRHGCPLGALYGDDGEMQCGICLVDFRRDSAEDIARKFSRANWQAPVPQLTKTFPCVLYFESREDVTEFTKIVQQAKPNFKVEALP